ncbi:hypothetical protein [Sideroxyarcus sp. TK5]
MSSQNENLKVIIDQLLSAQETAEMLFEKLQRMESHTPHLCAVTAASISDGQLLTGRVLSNLSVAQREIESRLPDYAFDSGVHWAAGKLNLSVACMFPTHLDMMLSHHDEGIRQVAVRCGDLSEEQLQKALHDPESWVRQAAETRKRDGNKSSIHRDLPMVTLKSIARVGKQ